MPISSTQHLCTEPPNECPEHFRGRRGKGIRMRLKLVQIPSLPFCTLLLTVYPLCISDPSWKLKQAMLVECGPPGRVRRARPADERSARSSACWDGEGRKTDWDSRLGFTAYALQVLEFVLNAANLPFAQYAMGPGFLFWITAGGVRNTFAKYLKHSTCSQSSACWCFPDALLGTGHAPCKLVSSLFVPLPYPLARVLWPSCFIHRNHDKNQ